MFLSSMYSIDRYINAYEFVDLKIRSTFEDNWSIEIRERATNKKIRRRQAIDKLFKNKLSMPD